MSDDLNSLDDLFNKVELYNELKFELFKKNEGDSTYKLDKKTLVKIINLLGVKQKTITTQCKWCKMNYPFEIDSTTDYLHGSGPMAMGSYVIFLAENLYVSRDYATISSKKEKYSIDELFDLFISTFEYTFTCTKDEKHKYKMYLSVKREGPYFSIMKIGQYPSMIDVWGFDFDIYKSQLNKLSSYLDFKKAELCFADGFTAGAYTYLRRVFEKMLDSYCKGKSLSNNRVETRIGACKDRFDARIHPMLNSLYKILSKGIHELDEEEASAYYQYLRAVILMQLEHVKEHNDKEAQTEQLNKAISEIASKLK